MVQHPSVDLAVELRVGERNALDVRDLGVEAAVARQLDHPRRNVDRPQIDAEIQYEPLGELAGAAADLEHPSRMSLLDGRDRDLVRALALDERAEDVVPPLESLLRRELARGRELDVEPHRSTIAWPATPPDSNFPPSHALTVAPTSAGSPSWMRPAAFVALDVGEQERVLARVVAADGVVGSQP